ncbi:MAG: TIM barrel protein [Lacunisphaera sp.]
MKTSPSKSAAGSAAPARPAPWELSVYADEIYPPAAGLEPALALFQRAGIKHTVLRVVNGRDSIVRLTNAEVDELGALLRKYGVRPQALDTPVFKGPLRKNHGFLGGYCPGFSDDMTFEDHLWYLGRAFEIADRLGVPEVRCHSFWREYAFDEAFNEVVDRLGQAAAQARAAGRVLYLQNEQDTTAATGVELARLLRTVNSPNLVAAYDLANSARLDGVPFPDDYEALHGLLGSVQVKFQAIDVRSGWGSPSHDLSTPTIPYPPFYFWMQEDLPISGHVLIGERRFELDGPRTFLPLADSVDVDHRAFLQRLKRDGYQGTISVDPGFHLPGTGLPADQRPETHWQKTIPDLQRLIAELKP